MNESLQSSISSLASGGYVLLVDDLGAKTRGFIICAAALCTPSHIQLLTSEARGVVTAPISESRLKELFLHPAQQRSNAPHRELAIGVEARFGVSTGVSAADRAHTLQVLATTKSPRTDLVIPGHIFPHLSKEGGVLVRAAAAEAATDLLTRTGLPAVAALAECLDENGHALDAEHLQNLAQKLHIPQCSISDLLCERLASESLVEQVTSTRLPLAGMEGYQAVPFYSRIDGAEHLALVRGSLKDSSEPMLVRVQAESRVADLFGVGPSQSRATMQRALQRIDEQGRGVFVYIRHPRKGAVAQQVTDLAQTPSSTDQRAVTLREYGVGAQIVMALGIKRLRLLTTKSRPIQGLESFGIEVVAHEQI